MRPSDEAIERVHNWLDNYGIESSPLRYNRARDLIQVDLPVSDIELLLDTRYSVYADPEGRQIVRATEWSLPIHLHEHITTIQPTTSFLQPHKRNWISSRDSSLLLPSGWQQAGVPPPILPPPTSRADVAVVCNTSLVTPLCLRTLYGTVNYTVKGKTMMSLNDFLDEVSNRSDTKIYLQRYRPEAAAAAYQFKQISINGGNLQQTPLNATQFKTGIGVEGNLDVETMLGMAWPLPLIVYSTGGCVSSRIE